MELKYCPDEALLFNFGEAGGSIHRPSDDVVYAYVIVRKTLLGPPTFPLRLACLGGMFSLLSGFEEYDNIVVLPQS